MSAQAEIDLAALTEPDSVIRVGDIVLSDAVTILTDPEEVVARIELPRAAEELVPELEAGETAAAGEAADSSSEE